MSKKLMRIIALIMIVFLLPSNALAKTPSPNGDKITKAEFIAIISDYFEWPHPTEYNDIWKAPLKQFNDVKTSDQYGKQIEVAYEEGIIAPDSNGNFNPNSGITRQDAAVILVKAFRIDTSDTETAFNDKDTISEEALGSVNALVELGYMDGRTSKLFMPNELIKKEEVNKVFNKITTSMVAPVQALPKQTTLEIDLSEDLNIAPRRFVKLYTPTEGAKIYYTKVSSSEGWPEVEDPTTDSNEYVLSVNGHISELVGLRSGELDAPDNYVVYKAIAVKDGKVSPVQTFRWHLYRPMDGDFQYKQIKEKAATCPAVYEIFRDNESVRAMAWYIEGEESGIVFDALQTPVNVENLKDYIDENIATKPYISIIGHEHGDHDAQVPNFIEGGIDVYLNQRGWASVSKPGFGGVVTTSEAQAKVKNVEEGMQFDLGGGTVFEVYALPGHANGNVALYDRQSGYLFSSDFYGCTRAGSADTVGISGVRADLLLSFVQQVYSKYTKDDSEVNALFTGHDESELSDNNLKLFEAALQQVIDNGEDGCTPSVRGSNNRTTMIGDMYKDGTNWIALELGGKMGDDREYLSSTNDLNALPYMSDPKNAGLNYNAGGHLKYSVLSNIEIKGGELVGKTVQWASDANPFQWAGQTITVNPSLENRFNPWSYDYTIIVPEKNNEITIIPTTMSTKVKTISIDGKKVDYRSENIVKVSDGTVITIDITAPDKVTSSTYTFTIEKGTVVKAIEPSVDNIKTIQAYTDLTFYGQKLTKVEIKYNGNVDLSGVTADTYILLDRGYSNPDFAEVTIDSVDVKGKTVTLNITQDTEALPDNALIYSGENSTGSRAKNPLGLYATGPWYRDVNGVIYFGSVDTDNYMAKTNNEGYQTRECLELKLYHVGENEDDAVCLANEDGSYNADGLWLLTIDANYGKRGFQTFEELDINVPTTATDGEKYVRGFAYFPKGYDKDRVEKYPMIITITGNGTSFWLLPDGTNNFGTGLNFDGSAFRWMDCDAIVLNIHDRSHTGGDDYKFWVDDYNVIQHFIENYNADPNAITLTGNSRGTMAIGRIYQEYPGIANTLIINNGSMGSRWTEVDWQNAAHNGTSIWAFDGELDTNNIAAYQTAKSYYKAAGWSDEWIAENIRLTGFPTELYYYWGETDHSTTKMTYWYFYDNPYWGPDAEIINGELVYNSKLNVDDTYELNGKLTGGVYNKEGFKYIIYGEALRDWVLSRD